ncbi:unnamed protein product [Effrenium voratum]|nr:unnamed protein product [Effrenium voratum]
MVRRAGRALLIALALLIACDVLSFCAPLARRGANSSRFTGSLHPAPDAPLTPAAAGTSAMSTSQVYFTGIGWYLMHFVVSIGNDSIMKFLGETLPPFQVVFLRFSTAALVLLPLLVIQGRSAFKSARLSMHFSRGLLLALGIGLWCFGLNLMPFASCVVINNTMPFFKMLFAQLILGEKVGKQRWLASLAGFIGCLIVFNPTAATFQPQSLVLILSACCFATRRHLYALLRLFGHRGHLGGARDPRLGAGDRVPAGAHRVPGHRRQLLAVLLAEGLQVRGCVGHLPVPIHGVRSLRHCGLFCLQRASVLLHAVGFLHHPPLRDLHGLRGDARDLGREKEDVAAP